MKPFAEREEHLRQIAERYAKSAWNDDEDVAICVAEIDRLRALAVETARATLRAGAPLPAKRHHHEPNLFAGNGQAFWYCVDRECGWQQTYVVGQSKPDRED